MIIDTKPNSLPCAKLPSEWALESLLQGPLTADQKVAYEELRRTHGEGEAPAQETTIKSEPAPPPGGEEGGIPTPDNVEYFSFNAALEHWDLVLSIPGPTFNIHALCPKHTQPDLQRSKAELWLENHSTSTNLDLPKLSFVMRLGPGEFKEESPGGYPFSVLPVNHKGNLTTPHVERDCLCLKRTPDTDTVVATSVTEYLKDVGLQNNLDAVWAHARPQPQKGPRKLCAGNVKFVPTTVETGSLTLETVGQLLPEGKAFRNFMILYELQYKENKHIAPQNGSNVAVLCTRKKMTVSPGRLLRITVVDEE